MATYGNRVKVNTATAGTGTVTLGSASSNAFCTFAEAGIADGSTVYYCIEDGTDFEIGSGVYTTAGTTMTRATVLLSKIGGTSGTTKITLSGSATVRAVLPKEGIGTAAAQNTGTSGANVPLLNGANIWSAGQTFSASPTFNASVPVAALLDAQQDFRLSGVISPTQITADQTDYAPTGHATASVFRLDTDATRTILSLAGGATGRVVLVQNIGANQVYLAHDDGATGTAAMRFSLAGARWLLLNTKQSCLLMYDGTSSRWRAVGPTLYAAQSDQEGAADFYPTVVPGTQQYHPSAAKCWVQGTPNSTTIITSYNITSLGDTATGQQTVTIATDFSSANYCALVAVGDNSTTLVKSATSLTKAAGSFIMNSVVEAGSGLDPSADWNAVCFGDQ